ncbi:LPXTG cell wall anchor domain-containing protein [Actinomadura scrupuli]|uniref:LPXTG cell wall anchor domain-containing protein n=1 Tax=Actinomadura scrupuli TaxID=559629 RepID=UPI003D96DB55
MRIARLAGATAAAGAVVLAGATPVFATAPVPSVTPNTIQVEGGFTATLTGCDAEEASIETDLLEGPSEALDKKATAGTFSKTFAGTEKTAEPGSHAVKFTCGETPAGSVNITVVAKPPKPPKPVFAADITPNPFRAGDRLTLRTSGCPTVPTVDDVDGLFTGPLVLKKAGGLRHSGSAVTKATLPRDKVFRVIVSCENVGKFTFTVRPGKKTAKHSGGQTGVVPVGGIDTGDGSSLRTGGSAVLPLTAGGLAVVVAGASVLAYRRRKASEGA